MSNEKIRKLITSHEGVRQHAYKDTRGFLTIGVGRNLDAKGLSSDEIQYLLTNDITIVINQLVEHISFFDALDEVRQAVLVDMAFNMGYGGLLKFIDTLNFIAESKYGSAADEMLSSAWATQVGQRAHELSEMMRTGSWPDGY